jgi:hypothetical protein
MASCASTSPAESTCPDTAPRNFKRLPMSSTTGPGRHSTGKPPPNDWLLY